MGDDSSRVVKAISHYQQNLEKYIDRRDEAKMIYCMEKLQRLPITVAHLEQTGVGRTVNSVRKMKGIRGSPKNTAKELVNRWKQLVTEESLNESEDDAEEEESDRYDNDDDGDDKDSEEERLEIDDNEGDHAEDSDEKEEVEVTRNISHRSRSRSGSHDRDTRETRVVKLSSENNDDDYYNFYNDVDREREIDLSRVKKEPDDGLENVKQEQEQEPEYDPEQGLELENFASLSCDIQVKKEKGDNKENGNTVNERSHEKEREKHRSREKDKDGKNGHRKSSSSSDKDKTKDKDAKYKNSPSTSSSSSKNKENKHRSSTSSSNREKDRERDKERERDKDRDKSKEKDKDKDKTREKDSGSNSSGYSTSKTSPEEKDKEKEKPKTTSSLHITSSTKKRTLPNQPESGEPLAPAKKTKVFLDDGIDCESGASFAEALGMMMPSTSKNKTTPKKDKDKDRDRDKDKDRDKERSKAEKDKSFSRDKEKDKKDSSAKDRDRERHRERDRDRHKDKEKGRDKERHKDRHSHSRKDRDKEKTRSRSDDRDRDRVTGDRERERSRQADRDRMVEAPSALRAPPPGAPKIDDLSSLLPQISTNYKPVGYLHLPGDSANRGKIVSDDEALTRLMYNKMQRTKVYSGNKIFFGKVPSLFDCCIRSLQDNIEYLGFTGGVPYSIIKPVLERATPDQLFTLEDLNPYLMEDTDELWQLHSQREFKTQKRREMETWREMFLRCADEREAKLKSLTASIKLSQDKSLPVRQTKLAYVDSVVKPPRNIARKQAKNGIVANLKPAVTPTSRLHQLALAGGADKISVPNPGAHRVNSGGGGGGGAASGSNYVSKPKKAPLMAKTLQALKGRFRR